MTENEVREQMAATWPLIKAMSEGKTVQARYRAGGPNAWVALTPQESINFDIRVCEYRIKEDLQASVIKLVDVALREAWEAQYLQALTNLTNKTRGSIRALFEENK